jgi:hypothetical protein
MIVVTTCPRTGASYLSETIASLGPYGDEAVVVDDAGCKGSRWNLRRALEAHVRWGRGGRMVLFQDDVAASPGVVEEMLTMEIPDDVGIVNFHDFGIDFMPWDAPAPGAHRFPAHVFGSPGMCGAQALVIPDEHVRWLLDTPTPPVYPHAANPHGADYWLGWMTARSPRPVKIVIRPSPVRHLGEVSACHAVARDGAPQPQAPMEAYAP